MKVITFDIATETGIAIFDNGELKKYYAFNISEYKTHHLKIKAFREHLLLLKEKHKPDIIIYEYLNVNIGSPIFNFDTTKFQIYLEGQVLEVFENVLHYNNKASLGLITYGNGNKRNIKSKEKKQIVLDYVNKKYGLDLKNNNISDSIILYDVAQKYNFQLKPKLVKKKKKKKSVKTSNLDDIVFK